VNISDLNYLEVVAEETQVQGGWFFPYTYYQNDKVALDIYTDIDLDDNSAVVEGGAFAFGKNTFTKVSFETYTTDYSSTSAVYSFSATD